MLKYLSRFSHLKTCFVLVRDDISNVYPIVEASLRILGGVFLDLSTSDDGLPDDVESVIPEYKLAIISDFSKQLHIADTLNEEAFFLFEKLGDNRIRVKLILNKTRETGKVLQSESSDRASMLATMLISPAARICEGHNIVGFLYKPDSLDEENNEKLNDYFCRVFREMFPEAGLVVFVRTRNIDESLYLPPVNLIGAIEADCFIKIMPPDETNSNIRRCATQIRKDNPTVFFLGAGSSSEANFLMGPDLCRKTLEQLVNGSPEDGYDELEQQFWTQVAVNDRWLPDEREMRDRGDRTPLTFERVVREQISQYGYAEAPIIKYISGIAENSTPSRGHFTIAEIIKMGYRILLVTTNYDNLIEQALDSYGLKSFIIFDEKTAEERFDEVKSYMRGETEIIPVIKLHGTINAPVTISASVQDTTSLKPMMRDLLSMILKLAEHKVIGIQERIPVIFNGYAFRDIDILKVISEPDIRDGTDCWVVDPLPRNPVTEFLSLDSRSEIITESRVLSTRFGLFMRELGRILT